MLPAFEFTTPGCPKCGNVTENPRYCRGLDHHEVFGPDAPPQMLGWLSQGNAVVTGCTTKGEHLHYVCRACGHHVLTATKDANRNAVERLLGGL